MKIRIISPAGHIDPTLVDQGAHTLRQWGFDVDCATHAKSQYGRYAATPPLRTNDIIDALNDPTVDIIWCARGGYGCMQIIDRIPTDLIEYANKPIVGYSDITCLHALWQKAGVRSMHAPMMRHLVMHPDNEASARLHNALLHYDKEKHFCDEYDWAKLLATHPLNILPEQHPSAQMIGGNLSVIHALHGTGFDFKYAGKILFIEDIGESPYKVDRMMQSLRLAGVFEEIKGLVVGQFTEFEEDPMMKQSMLENIRNMLLPYDIPVRFDAPIGHVPLNIPVVEGAKYII